MTNSDRIIPMWTICYDGNADRVYNFTDYDKAIVSVESSIRGYYGEDSEEIDDICSYIVETMNGLRGEKFIPLKFDNLYVFVYAWNIDSSSRIHQLLTESYHTTSDEDLKNKIDKIFENMPNN
jgi:anaerobic ribonucleoside-triphosphate reductase